MPEIRIKEDLGEQESEIFNGIKYLVEFLLYDDYFSSGSSIPGHNAGYLDLSGLYCVVTVDYEGGMNLEKNNPLRIYTSRYYVQDYSTIIEDVIDLHESYNQLIEFAY